MWSCSCLGAGLRRGDFLLGRGELNDVVVCIGCSCMWWLCSLWLLGCNVVMLVVKVVRWRRNLLGASAVLCFVLPPFLMSQDYASMIKS